MNSGTNRGFSVVEILIALAISMLVMASVFLLLQQGQESFRREPEVAETNANTRFALDRVTEDLMVAGFQTPANAAVLWSDGGGDVPDGLTVIYSDPDVPVARPRACKGPCGTTIGSSSTLALDPGSFSFQPPDFEGAYQSGATLIALQGRNGDPACESVPPGIVSLELTEAPKCAGSGGLGASAGTCGTLNLAFRSAAGSKELNLPGGFENDVIVDCAVIGRFHVVQYRVNPLPPAPSPELERRDVLLNEPWSAVAANIENFQVQYVQGLSDEFFDAPRLPPLGADPSTWVTRVRLTVSGRSESANLKGGTSGVFAAEDTHLRRAYTTTVSLRNQLGHAQETALELGLPGWN
jgi:type II secretory pathway pseudopilin PulG